jgi:hypothetical protein
MDCSGHLDVFSGKFHPIAHINDSLTLVPNSPLIGGAFSNPATRYPSLFDYELFRKFPYFLPCLVSAAVALFSAATAYLFLNEVRPHHGLDVKTPS